MLHIPTEVQRSDLIEALRPLFALIGVDEMNLSGSDSITIEHEWVEFSTIKPRARVSLQIVGGVAR